jgi:hypothetical protein
MQSPMVHSRSVADYRDTITVDTRCKLHGDRSLCLLVQAWCHAPPWGFNQAVGRAQLQCQTHTMPQYPDVNPQNPVAQPAHLAHNKQCETHHSCVQLPNIHWFTSTHHSSQHRLLQLPQSAAHPKRQLLLPCIILTALASHAASTIITTAP